VLRHEANSTVLTPVVKPGVAVFVAPFGILSDRNIKQTLGSGFVMP
jgi:hypothetical protein